MLPNSWVLNMSLTENLTLGWNADISEKHPNQTNFLLSSLKVEYYLNCKVPVSLTWFVFFRCRIFYLGDKIWQRGPVDMELD